MNVLIFLPPACRGVDTMAKVILHKSGRCQSNERGTSGETHTSLSLSAETSDHLNSACPPRVPPRMGSNMIVVVGVKNKSRDSHVLLITVRSQHSHERTGPRQNPGDHGGKRREASVALTSLALARSSISLFPSLRQCCLIPFLPVL
jgi:hypothetical protein